MVVGGWGRLVQDGRNVAALTDAHDGSRSGFSAARHPRSAVGVTRDSSALLLVVVDGRRPWSVGMSLEELAQRLLSFGAVQGANLDGGGSSTLWVGGTVVNYPSDTAGERPVANAVVVLRRR
jgi:exopolysaccharide biosynthesis protein